MWLLLVRAMSGDAHGFDLSAGRGCASSLRGVSVTGPVSRPSAVPRGARSCGVFRV